MHAAHGVITRERIFAAAVLLTAAAIRCIGVDAHALWWDEGWSVYFASLPVADMIDATASDIHPPFYYLLLHLWTAALGYSPVALRTLSMLAGLGTVWAGWRLGRALLGPAAGMVAALLLALSPLQAFYSQEVRMYALVTGLGLLSWLALVRGDLAGMSAETRGEPSRRAWTAVYVAATALALYAEYYAALLWAGQAAYVVLSRRGQPAATWRRSLTTLAAPPLLFLPWTALAVPRLLRYVSQKQAIEGYTAFDPLTFLWDHLSAFAAGHAVSPGSQVWIVGASLGLIALAVAGWLWARERPGTRLLLATYGLLPLGLGYLIHVLFPFTPPFYERVMLLFSPPFYLAAACGLTRFARGRGAPRIALSAAAVLLPSLNLLPLWTQPRSQGTDYRPLFEVIKQSGSAADAILCVHPWQYGYAVAYLPPRLRHPVLAPTDRWADPAERDEDLGALVEANRVLWFPSHESLGRILERSIAADLDRRAARVHAGWADEETLLLAYASVGDGLTSGGAGSFRDGPALLASQFSGMAESGSGVVHVDLEWGDLSPGDDLEASLRLVDGLGRAWASRDFELAQEARRQALLVPWGTPAVPLELTLTLARDGAELEVETGPPGRRALPLGTVQIQPPAEAAPPLQDLGAAALDMRLDTGLSLEGRGPLPAALAQGDELPVDLWWAAAGPLAQEPVLFIQALGPDGRVVAAAERRITSGLWPPTEWPGDAFLRDPQVLLLPADAPAGRLTVVAGLLDPESRQRLRADSADTAILGHIEVREVERSFSMPAVANTTATPFADLATLAGFEVEACPALDDQCLAAEGSLDVRLVWRAERATGTRYRSFVHLSCSGEIVAQSDGEPGGGHTTAWLPGQYVSDRHRLSLSRAPGCAAGLSLEVGLYDPATGVRLEPGSETSEDGKLVLVTAQAR